MAAIGLLGECVPDFESSDWLPGFDVISGVAYVVKFTGNRTFLVEVEEEMVERIAMEYAEEQRVLFETATPEPDIFKKKSRGI